MYDFKVISKVSHYKYHKQNISSFRQECIKIHDRFLKASSNVIVHKIKNNFNLLKIFHNIKLLTCLIPMHSSCK